MADKKISELAAASALDTDDLIPVVEDGTTKKATIQNILDLAPSGNGIPTVINAVTDYGATGDGVTNDRTAIQNALSAADAAGGGIVYFPAGTYLVGVSATTGSMLAVPSNVTIRGEGPQATIIKSGSTATGHNLFSVSAESYVRFESLGLDAVGTTTSSQGIVIGTASTHCAVVDCYVAAKWAWAVQTLADSNYIQIVRCVLGSLGNTIEINGCSYVTIDSCHLYASTNNGIELWDAPSTRCVGLKVVNNDIVGPTAGGIICFGLIGAVIEGNRISDCGTYGIRLQEDEGTGTRISRECVVANNVVKGSDVANIGAYGIHLNSGARRCTVTGNTVEGTLHAMAGMVIDGIDNTVSGNVCYLNGGAGMIINTTADRSTVIGNVCVDNSGTGVGSRNGLSVDGDYCTIIGNTASDTRGGSARQQFGVAVSGTGNILLANNGTGNVGVAVYNGGTSTVLRSNIGTADSAVQTGTWNTGDDIVTGGKASFEVGYDGSFQVKSTNTATVPFYFQGATSQTSDLTRWVNPDGSALLVGVTADGSLTMASATGLINFTHASQVKTTVGAAGAASALPATPSKYIKVLIAGTEYVIPAYTS